MTTNHGGLAEFLLARIKEDQHFGTHDRHLAKRWDAECEAKRAIVREVTRLVPENLSVNCPQTRILKAMALPYADHPDYRQEWRP